MKLTTTFNLLRQASACTESYRKLARHLGGVKTYGEDTEINLLTILESNGFDDCIWSLHATSVNSDKVTRLLAADFAETVLHLFELNHPDDQQPRKAIQAAREFANGLITIEEMRECRRRAQKAAYAYSADAAYSAAYADSAYAAAYAAAYSADTADSAAAADTADTAYAAAYAYADSAYSAYAAAYSAYSAYAAAADTAADTAAAADAADTAAAYADAAAAAADAAYSAYAAYSADTARKTKKKQLTNLLVAALS